MKLIGFIIIILLSLNSFSQDSTTLDEEFIPITIEEKEAFMSTKTGEFVFREHAKTDATALKTTNTGVIYTDVKTHAVKKGETLSVIARKYGLSISALKTQNKLAKTGLSIGQKLKVVKKIPVKSSSPVIGTSGEETIVARLRPGQTPASLNAPSVNITKEKEIKASVNNTVKSPIQKSEVIKKDIVVTKKEASIEKKEEAMKVITKKKEASIEKGNAIKKDVIETKKEVSIEKSDDIKKDIVVTKKEVSIEKGNAIKKNILVSKEDKVKNIVKTTVKSSYKVKKGDTLYGIAKRFGISVQDLKKINGLVLNKLSIGQELKINQK